MKTQVQKINVLGEYDVVVGTDLIEQLEVLFDFEKYSKIFVLTDLNLEKSWFEKVKSSIKNQIEKIVVNPGEQFKNITTIQEIWRKLQTLGADRKSLLINLGGGVIGDTGGFAASTYMRGIDFLQIPTTLLSQVDASIGGKVGINFDGVKNLIGSFNQPVGVLCDVSILKTLPKREFIEGFGEVIKHGIIADKQYFNFVTSKRPLEFNQEELGRIIKRSCEIKKEIVEGDVTEKNSRRLVNFGHTIGHALESISLETKNPLLHGEAVSLGMVAEARISVIKGLLKDEQLQEVIKVLEDASLPIRYEIFETEKVLKNIKSDKKSEGGKVYFTLIKAIGKAVTGQRVLDEEIIKALEFIKP